MRLDAEQRRAEAPNSTSSPILPCLRADGAPCRSSARKKLLFDSCLPTTNVVSQVLLAAFAFSGSVLARSV